MSNALKILFQDIADAIRSKTGDTATMNPTEFPDRIAAIESSKPQEIIRVSGEYTPSIEGSITVVHDLGLIPDIIMVESNLSTSGYLHDAFGCADEIAQDGNCRRVHVYNASQITTIESDSSIYANDTTDGHINSVTPSTFTVGGSTIKNDTNATYKWTVIGGLVSRAGYFFMRLRLDGNGNLIVSGGVPEISQLNIYVDGTLAKTVDYVHADEVTFDITDVASEVRKYTITVDGVGEDLETLYPYAFYETITGYSVPLEGSCGESVNWRLESNGGLIIYGDGAMTDYTSATERPWHDLTDTITSVTIETGVTSIGDYALYGCTNPTSIDIPSDITNIGDYAFCECTALVGVVIPNGVKTIMQRAFQQCTNLESVTIGSGVKTIGENAFYGCNKLASATFKDTTTWKYNSSETSTSGTTLTSSFLADTSIAASYLTSNYVSYWWHKV